MAISPCITLSTSVGVVCYYVMMVKVVVMIMAISPCITLSTSVGVVCCYVMMVKVVVVDNGDFSLHNA